MCQFNGIWNTTFINSRTVMHTINIKQNLCRREYKNKYVTEVLRWLKIA